MKHKIIMGISDDPERFESDLDEFRLKNKVSDKHFVCQGRFLYMLFEYTHKTKPKAPSEDTTRTASTEVTETRVDGAEVKDEGLPTT